MAPPISINQIVAQASVKHIGAIDALLLEANPTTLGNGVIVVLA